MENGNTSVNLQAIWDVRIKLNKLYTRVVIYRQLLCIMYLHNTEFYFIPSNLETSFFRTDWNDGMAYMRQVVDS